MLDNTIIREINCKSLSIPEDITITLTPTMKIERLVDKIHTFKKLGVQVFHIRGNVNRLIECGEFIAKISKDVSIFIDEPQKCPKSLRKYTENC